MNTHAHAAALRRTICRGEWQAIGSKRRIPQPRERRRWRRDVLTSEDAWRWREGLLLGGAVSNEDAENVNEGRCRGPPSSLSCLRGLRGLPVTVRARTFAFSRVFEKQRVSVVAEALVRPYESDCPSRGQIRAHHRSASQVGTEALGITVPWHGACSGSWRVR